MSDGEGTPIGISSRSLTIALSPSTPNQINASSQDSIPPYFETVEVSHDPDTFDGKYFLSFHAVDDLSGIARYEVVEDNVTTEAKNGVYVLRDQERNSKIIIIAHDQAGNSASIKVPTKYESLILWGGFGLVLLTVLLVVIIYRRQIRSVFRRFI